MQFTMKQQRKLILTLICVMIFSKFSFGQIWPVTQMTRFGNAIYIKTESSGLLDDEKATFLFEKGLENRYFDILTSKDSLGIKFNDKIKFFHQKGRDEPKDSKTIAFYSRRKLKNEKMIIRYLKLIEVTDKTILAQATVKYKGSRKEKEKIEINISDLKGIFIGPGEKMRLITTIYSWTSGVLFVLLL